MKNSVGAVSLVFPNPVLVVGTYDIDGRANALTLAWGGVAASEPPAVCIAVRPSRYSHEALHRTRAFTVNLPSARYAAEADYFGIVSGSKVDKFATTGLTPVHGTLVDAPYIAEFPYVMECAVTHAVELGTHTLFVGEVKDVKVDNSLLADDGTINWSNADILTFDAAARAYRAPGEAVAQAFNVGKKFISR
ncbi:MAG: flavin reductase family protein [Coriobacteriales bacterium]|nr:flavin reductase family protein [Coriobacteriales bacterium]